MKAAGTIRDIYRNSCIFSRDTAAYHGTSLQALKYMAETGVMGSSFEKEGEVLSNSVRKGDFFVIPVKGRCYLDDPKGTHIVAGAAEEVTEAFGKAMTYAETASEDHFLRETFGVPMDRPCTDETLPGSGLTYDWAIEFTFTLDTMLGIEGQHSHTLPFYTYLLDRGYSEDDINDLFFEARTRKGVVLSFRNDIFAEGEPLPAGEGVRVINVTPEKIAGIKPLDRYTEEFLESL
ncbi:MAG: hypothetical protein J7K54_04250 [Candidatus Aenigmarchaeota archaeon]|nr:hypothetical protein [Candidatus Aenigmarchaeota archaeon]